MKGNEIQLSNTPSQLERIEEKLDMIIHALGLDGRKSPLDIKQDVKSIVVELRERQLTKLKKKATKGTCP